MHPIIKEYLEKGLIDKEAAARLESFEEMVKEAGYVEKIKEYLPKFWEGFKNVAKSSVAMSGPLIGVGAGALAANYLNTREIERIQNMEREDLDYSYKEMLSMMPKRQLKNINDIRSGFNTVARISPTLAGTPTVVAKVVERIIDKGLTEKDMQNLYLLESNAQHVKRVPRMKTWGAELAEKIVPPVATAAADLALDQIGFTPKVFLDTSLRMSGSGAPPTRGASPLQQQISDMRSKLLAVPEEERKEGKFYNRDVFIERIRAAAEEGKIVSGLDLRTLDFNLDSDIAKIIPLMGEAGTGPLGRELFPEMELLRRKKIIKEASLSPDKRAEILANAHILIKEAKLPEGFLTGLLTAAAIGVGTGAINLAASEISKSQRERVLENSWKRTQKNLLEMTADGSELSKGVDYTNPQTLNKAQETFQTLIAVAPDLASNSTIATTYVSRLMQTEGVDISALKTISEIQKNMGAVSGYKGPFETSPTIKGFESGFQMAGGKDLISAFAKEQIKGSQDSADKLFKHVNKRLGQRDESQTKVFKQMNKRLGKIEKKI